jgi:hypothetical protein
LTFLSFIFLEYILIIQGGFAFNTSHFKVLFSHSSRVRKNENFIYWDEQT